MSKEITYSFDEFIPAEHAISGHDYWYGIPDSLITDREKAIKVFNKLKRQGRKVRLVETVKTVIKEC